MQSNCYRWACRHPVYDRLKREWQEEERARRLAQSDAIARSINAKLELMRQRRLAAEAEEAAERDADGAGMTPGAEVL